MKFFVISDTHGNIDKVLEVFEHLKDIDQIIHLGDYYRDAQRIEDALDKPVAIIRGNNDSKPLDGDFKILETEYGKILLTHGHLEHVKFDLQRLQYKAEELGCKAALFGHTHLPIFIKSAGLYMLNPGSLSLPADGTGGSYAIVNTSKDTFSASIVYYTQFFKRNDGSDAGNNKTIERNLWDLLNNSDRF